MNILRIGGLVVGLILGALLAVYFSAPHFASAAPSRFVAPNCKTAAATTTITWMTPGAGTTTLSSCFLGNDGADVASLILQVNASSTATRFVGAVEESMDGIDWYRISPSQTASTSSTIELGTKGSFAFNFASSTIGGVAVSTGLAGYNGTNNREDMVIDVPVRMKYVRAHVGIAGGTTNGGVWMQVLPKRED